MDEARPAPVTYITVEIRTQPALGRLYPPQKSLAAAVEVYAHANELPTTPAPTLVRAGRRSTWRLDKHSGGRAMVLTADLPDHGRCTSATSIDHGDDVSRPGLLHERVTAAVVRATRPPSRPLTGHAPGQPLAERTPESVAPASAASNDRGQEEEPCL